MSNKTRVVSEAIELFPALPTRAIARYLVDAYGPLFDNDLDKARQAVRYHLGSSGELNRKFRPKVMREVKMPQTWRRTRKAYHLDPGLWLVLSDIHIPFHEPKPLESALQYGKNQKITGIFLNGDIQDCAAVSFWPSAMKRDFDKEVVAFIDFLDLLAKEFKGIPIVYKPGNHEYRLPRYFQKYAPELIGTPLAAMETVLALEQRGIEFLDYQQIVMAGKLPILHGDEVRVISRAVNPARGLFLRTKSWAMCGHCHSTSEHTSKDINDTLLTTWSMGCLCDLHPDYNPFGNDWNWGVGTVGFDKSGAFEVNNRRILSNGKVV